MDSRILVLSKKNGGLSSARNAGLDTAAGKYYSFIDSDDFVDPEFIHLLYSNLIKYGADFSTCGRYLFTSESENSKQALFTENIVSVWAGDEAIIRFLTWDNIDGSVCDKLFKRELFETRRFSLTRISEDVPVIADLLTNIDLLVHVGKPLYYYRQRNDSITKRAFTVDKMTILLSAKEVLETIIKRYPNMMVYARSYYFKHLI